jgi:hypothetical protein
MPPPDKVDDAVESALKRLVEAIYARSEALGQNVPVAEYAKLNARVEFAEQEWKLARSRSLQTRPRKPMPGEDPAVPKRRRATHDVS